MRRCSTAAAQAVATSQQAQRLPGSIQSASKKGISQKRDWHDFERPRLRQKNWVAVDAAPLAQKTLVDIVSSARRACLLVRDRESCSQDKSKIPSLAHGLDRVVKDESFLHPLRDLETQDFNFNPALQEIKSLEVTA